MKKGGMSPEEMKKPTKNECQREREQKMGGGKKRDRLLRSECMNEGREEGEEEEGEEDWW